MAERRMVTVDRFVNATDAETARALLEMEGIESMLVDAEIERVIGTAPGGIGLMVDENDAERAREILDCGPLGPDVTESDVTEAEQNGTED